MTDVRAGVRRWARFVLRPIGPPPRPTRRNLIFDVLLAIALAYVAIRYATSGQDVPELINDAGSGRVPLPPGNASPDDDGRRQAAVAAIAAAAALVLRRRYPLAVLWVVLGITVFVASNEPRLTFYACVIAAYSAAAYSRYRVPAIATAALTAVAITVDIDAGIPIVESEYIPLLVLAPVVVAADGLRRWKIRVDENRRRLAEMQREQEEAVRLAATEERARIARELHDVVTHNVSVMVIQAGAARKVMGAEPDQASEALLAVEAGGRAAMAELRQVVGLLQGDGAGGAEGAAGDAADLSPQPGLDRLESLVARVRDAGQPVELGVVGAPYPLPPGVELAAYRVVQEALTNTMKHASGASATVTVEYRDDSLRVDVLDTGGSPTEAAGAGNGRGLIGLRERLAVYGGTLSTGRRLTGGYRVESVIPVESS